jgi:ribosomal protein S14
MTKYLRPEPFSVGSSGTKQSGENWEATFGKGHDKCPECGSLDTRSSPLDPVLRTCRTCFAEFRVVGAGSVP